MESQSFHGRLIKKISSLFVFGMVSAAFELAGVVYGGRRQDFLDMRIGRSFLLLELYVAKPW